MKPLVKNLSALLFLAATLLVMLVVGSGSTSAETLTVNDDGGADYTKIQDAVDAAENGDTIRVYEGTYYENVVVNKSVDLFGNGSDITTIDCGGEGDVVHITSDWVNMSGFNVIGSVDSWDSVIKVESDHNLIFENKCSNKYIGIYLEDSNDCTIENNTCRNNRFGIWLYYSSYCTITNNTCDNIGESGINLAVSSACTIMNNRMVENGISISGFLKNWNSHTIETTNTVNGKPVYYYKNVTGFTVPYGAGQVILANCTRINVENQNCSNGSGGIYVGYSSNITLENNTCNSNNRNGISLEDLSDCTLTNNTCSNNGGSGIILSRSSDCVLENNTCENDDRYGIWLWESSDCTIENNTCRNNRFGIWLWKSGDYIITNNTISENKIGIYLYRSSRDNTAHYNNIYNNTESGINATDNSGYTINATYNWWGSNSGPYHTTKNPDGKGDNVTDYVEFTPWTTTLSDLNFIEVINTDSCLKIREDAGMSSNVIQCVPDSWVLKIVDTHEDTIAQDGFIWWEVEDPTTGVRGWAAKEFLNQGGQTELSEKVQTLTTPEERTPIILKAMNHYYQNEDSKSSLYSSKDGNNDFTVFEENNFPIELILAIAVQESGDFDFDNEVYGMDKVGDFENGGVGIMQITGNNKGWGSNLQCYCEHCGKADSTHLYSYPGGERYKHKYYTNSYQGIYANIKDGFRVLQWAYQDALRVNADNPIAGAVWRYNAGSQWITQAGEYLVHIGARLLTLSEYYGENYASYFQGYQPLSEEDIQAWSNDLQNYIIASIHSPGELGMYDSQGRFTGVTNGEVTIEIPDTDYYEGHVITFLANDSYYYEVVGTDEGTYGLTITSVKNGTLTNFTVIDIPTNKSEVHTYSIDWDALSQGEKAVTITIDREGDGKVDYTIQSNETFTKDEYDAAMKGEGDGENGDSDSFLFENIGPLPLIGYIGIVTVIAMVGVVAVKKRKEKPGKGMTPATVLSQPPPPAQSPSHTQLPYQQPPQPPPTQPPQQASPQQFGQPQQYQQYAQAPQVPSQEIPMQADGTWTCPQCGNEIKGKFIFCTECGFKRAI